MPNSSKKRKAVELDRLNEHAKTARPKATKRKRTRSKRKHVALLDDIPFISECPLVSSDIENAYVGIEDLADGFSFDFAVRPGDRWQQMRSYKNIRFNETTFQSGGIVYINKTSPPPNPPPPDASDEQVLAYDRNNFWVARIAEARAVSAHEVYLRVFWLYWPEELPMGRQSYHAVNELILSNAMDIVDAQTLSCAAEVLQWDESDVDAKVGERFWRQTFDVGKLGADQQGGLSVLKKHCTCQQPHNPDKIMFQCKDTECETWNHEQCLVDELKALAYHHYVDDTLDQLVATIVKPDDSKDGVGLLTPLQDLGRFVHNVLPGMSATPEPRPLGEANGVSSTQMSSSKQRSRARKSTSSAPSNPSDQEKLQVSLTTSEDEDGYLMAKVEELIVPNIKRKGVFAKTGKIWLINVHCLKCKRFMD